MTDATNTIKGRKGFASVPIEQRFWAKVEKTETCWLWRGAMDGNGYGQIWVNGRKRKAHAASYEMVHGPVPDGLELDHVCRTKDCVRPDHLEAVTHRENMRRAYADITHCRNGHEYTYENTYMPPNDRRRVCRMCAGLPQNRSKEAKFPQRKIVRFLTDRSTTRNRVVLECGHEITTLGVIWARCRECAALQQQGEANRG